MVRAKKGSGKPRLHLNVHVLLGLVTRVREGHGVTVVGLLLGEVATAAHCA